MTLPVVLRPKRPRWYVASLGIALAAIVASAVVMWWRGWSPGDAWGLTFGTLAGLLMLLAALYPLRRRLMFAPLRTAQHWLQIHIYGSTVAALFVLIHMGYRLPHGQFGWWLFALTLWTTVSGLAGVALQKWIPALVTGQLTVEVIYERIPEMIERIQAEAAKTASGASDVLQRFYDGQVQPAIAGLSPSWSYLLDVHSGREKRLATFEHIQSFVAPEEKEKLADLRSLVAEKIEIDAHYSLQRILRLWPLVHVPPAMLLMAAIIAHVAAVVYY
jgi:hypothetical protein